MPAGDDGEYDKFDTYTEVQKCVLYMRSTH